MAKKQLGGIKSLLGLQVIQFIIKGNQSGNSRRKLKPSRNTAYWLACLVQAQLALLCLKDPGPPAQGTPTVGWAFPISSSQTKSHRSAHRLIQWRQFSPSRHPLPRCVKSTTKLTTTKRQNGLQIPKYDPVLSRLTGHSLAPFYLNYSHPSKFPN